MTRSIARGLSATAKRLVQEGAELSAEQPKVSPLYKPSVSGCSDETIAVVTDTTTMTCDHIIVISSTTDSPSDTVAVARGRCPPPESVEKTRPTATATTQTSQRLRRGS